MQYANKIKIHLCIFFSFFVNGGAHAIPVFDTGMFAGGVVVNGLLAAQFVALKEALAKTIDSQNSPHLKQIQDEEIRIDVAMAASFKSIATQTTLILANETITGSEKANPNEVLYTTYMAANALNVSVIEKLVNSNVCDSLNQTQIDIAKSFYAASGSLFPKVTGACALQTEDQNTNIRLAVLIVQRYLASALYNTLLRSISIGDLSSPTPGLSTLGTAAFQRLRISENNTLLMTAQSAYKNLISLIDENIGQQKIILEGLARQSVQGAGPVVNTLKSVVLRLGFKAVTGFAITLTSMNYNEIKTQITSLDLKGTLEYPERNYR